MPAVRDAAVTEVTTAAATATPDMPVHEAGDILVIFANKDSTTGMTETSGLYTLLNSGDITTTAWSGCYWRRALSNNETPPTFTWTSETANFVIVAVKGAHGTNPPVAYLSSDDSTIPYTQDQSITTPSVNCLVLHGVGNDVGIGAEPYPGVAQIIYAGDAGANGIGVSWAFYPAAGSIGNPTFWGWQQQPTQIHTVVIEDDGTNAEVQGYVDRGTTPCTIVSPMVGATLFGWAHQTALSQPCVGVEWASVWTYNGTTWVNETVDMNDPGTADVPMSNLINSELDLGSNTKFSQFCLYVSTAASGGTVVWEYYNGASWVTLPGVTDYMTATGAHTIKFSAPANWAQIAVQGVTAYWIRLRTSAARTTGATFTQGLRDGAACTYDAITAGADLGVNPYHNVAQYTPSSATYNLGGNEMLYSGGTDLSSGYLVGTFQFSTPRVWVNTSYMGRLGITVLVLDTSNNYKLWIIGAKDGTGTYADRRDLFAIQLDETEVTSKFSLGAFSAALVDTLAVLTCQPYGAMTINFSMLMRTGLIVVAGGRPAAPLDFDDLVTAVVNGCCLFPFLYQSGSAATVWAPIRIGGGDPVHIVVDLKTFQFPAHYSEAAGRLEYHVDADQNGIEFYPKSGDTVKFTNCVFTGESSYTWGFNASSSAGATVDFGGTSVVGANVYLDDAITLSNVKFSRCKEIDAAGATLAGCTFDQTVGTRALTVDSVAELDKIDDCVFTNNARALRITAAGTYTLDGSLFSGNTYDIENSSAGLVTINCINGANPTTFINTGGGSTVINNQKSLTLTGILADSEVRIFAAGTTTELDGTESSGTTFVYNYNYSAGTYVDIVLIKIGRLYFRINSYLLPDANGSIPIQQTIDRTYSNP